MVELALLTFHERGGCRKPVCHVDTVCAAKSVFHHILIEKGKRQETRPQS